MTPLTHEWVGRAEEDFDLAVRELRRRKNPALNSICFHAQQSAEKYLKARINHAGLRFAWTHDLIVLLDQLTPIEPQWELLRPMAASLSEYAVKFRYPGVSATRHTARNAVASCREIREHARTALGLSIGSTQSKTKSSRPKTKQGGAQRRRKKK